MTKHLLLAINLALLLTSATADAAETSAPDYRAGHSFMPTRIYTANDDQAVLEAFQGLRVADVTDGMDFAGLKGIGLMDPEVHALWKDPENYQHRFIGIALTVRYVPTQKPARGGDMSYEEFRAWEGAWYNELSPEPFMDLIRKGTAIVIDEAPDADVGSIGSFNIMAWQMAGAVGVVTDATARDTDEIITQKIPLYFRKPGRGYPAGPERIGVDQPASGGGGGAGQPG